MPDLSGARFRLQDGEGQTVRLAFDSGVPGTIVSGTMSIGDSSTAFQGMYQADGTLELKPSYTPEGTAEIRLDVRRLSAVIQGRNVVRTQLSGSGTVTEEGSTQAGTLSGECETACPY